MRRRDHFRSRPAPHQRRRVVPVVILLALFSSSATVLAARANAAASTASVNNLRTAWDDNEPGLSPGSVTASNFGKLFSAAVDGQVYAEPIVASGSLITATENDKVYGMDPARGAIRWSTNLSTPWPAATIGCGGEPSGHRADDGEDHV